MFKVHLPSPKYLPNRLRNNLGLFCVAGMCILSFGAGSFLSHKPLDSTNTTVSKSELPSLALNTAPDLTLPTLCIVARIYWAQISYFPVFALSLYHTGLHNVRIYVVNTDNRTDIQQLKQVIQLVNDLVACKNFVIFLELGEPSDRQDFGYGMTDRALAHLYEQHTKSSSICQYVTFTNADNLYSRNLTRKILPQMQAGKDIIAWGFITRYVTPYQEFVDPTKKTVPEIVDDGTEKCLPARLKRFHIDLGAVAYKLSFLHKDKLYFLRPNWTDLFTSDGYFVEDAAARTNASVLLRQTLYVHQ